VVVEGDRIREVSDTPVTLQHAQRIDLGGKTLMPGLIDAHVPLIATSLNLSNLVNEPASLTTARTLRIAEGMLQRGFIVLALPIRQRSSRLVKHLLQFSSQDVNLQFRNVIQK
jgi:predicted amidohydrolase